MDNSNRLRTDNTPIGDFVNRVIDSVAKKASVRVFGPSPNMWIFIIGALIVSLIPTLFPVANNGHGSYYYLSMTDGEISWQMLLFASLLLGVLGSLFLTKVPRIIITLAIGGLAIMASVETVSKHSSFHPSYGFFILLAGIAAFIYFASRSNEDLAKYPNPVKDPRARYRWIYVALALVAMLIYGFGYANSNGSDREYWPTGFYDLFLSMIAIEKDEPKGWLIQLFMLLPAMAACLVFLKKRILSIVMALAMLVPAFYFMSALDKSFSIGSGVWLYLFLVIPMVYVAMQINGSNKTADSDNKTAEATDGGKIAKAVAQFIKKNVKVISICAGVIAILAIVLALVSNYNNPERLFSQGREAYETMTIKPRPKNSSEFLPNSIITRKHLKRAPMQQ